MPRLCSIPAGIFFKFIDFSTIPHIYPSACEAQKATRHELACASSIAETEQGVRVPLAAIIDYLGFRLLAVIAMPIGSNTLLYVTPLPTLPTHARHPPSCARRMRLSTPLCRRCGG